jgi:WD40 repeat protein
MVWGIGIGILAWGVSAFAAIPDKLSCAAYLDWFALQHQVQYAQAHAAEPGISEKAKSYWDHEFVTLREQLETYKRLLLEEAAQKAGRQFEPGSTVEVLSASTTELTSFHRTRPADKPNGARVLKLSDDGERMVVVPKGSSNFQLWDLPKNMFWTLSLSAEVVDAAFDWNGNILALDSAGRLALFAADGRRLKVNLPVGPNEKIALSREQLLRLDDGIHLSSALRYSGERTLDLPSPKGADFIRISADSHLGAIAFGGEVHVIDLKNGARLKTFPQFSDSELVALEFAPGSHRLVGLAESGSLSVWDPRALKTVTVMKLEQLEGQCLALDATGHAFVGGSQYGGIDGVVAVVDLHVGEEIGRYNPGHAGGVGAIALSFDKKMLVTTAAKDEHIHFHHNPAE